MTTWQGRVTSGASPPSFLDWSQRDIRGIRTVRPAPGNLIAPVGIALFPDDACSCGAKDISGKKPEEAMTGDGDDDFNDSVLLRALVGEPLLLRCGAGYPLQKPFQSGRFHMGR